MCRCIRPTFAYCFMLMLTACLLLASCSSKPQNSVRGTNTYTVRGDTYHPLQTGEGYIEDGIASWYGPGFHGKKTANGERYNQNALTAAHKTLPLGTVVRVTNLENDKSIILRINDRGPFKYGRVIDVSRRAAHILDMHDSGTAKVRVVAISERGKIFAPPSRTPNRDNDNDRDNDYDGDNDNATDSNSSKPKKRSLF